MMKIKDSINNFLLKVRNSIIEVPKVDFGIPSFVSNFETDKFNTGDNVEYGSNMVFLKDNVKVENGILKLYAKPYNLPFTDWDGNTEIKEWSCGMIDYRYILEKKWGVWSATIKLPKDCWPAFWLLRKRHWSKVTLRNYTIDKTNGNIIYFKEPFERIDYNWFVLQNNQFIGFVCGYNKELNYIVIDREVQLNVNDILQIGPDHIIPEVDIMEAMQKNGKSIIKHTLHYRYELFEYKGLSGGPWVREADEEWHEYSVDVCPRGYKFYIDGILTGIYTDKLSIENVECYPILNIAVHPNRKQEELVMEIKNLKYYGKG